MTDVGRVAVVGGRTFPCGRTLADCTAGLEAALADVTVERFAGASEARERLDWDPAAVVWGAELDGEGRSLLEDVGSRRDSIPLVYLAGDTEESVPATVLTADVAECVTIGTADDPSRAVASAVEAAIAVAAGPPDIEGVPVLDVGADGRVLASNAAGSDLLEAPLEAGRPIGECLSGEFATALEDAVQGCREADDACSFDAPHPNGSGWLAGHVRPEGNGHRVICHDVTEYRERIANLGQYRRIVEASGDLVYALDEEGRFTHVNEAATELLGYDADELVGSHVSRVTTDAFERASRERIAELVGGDGSGRATVEGELVTVDGDRIPVENHLALLPAENGDFSGTVGVVRDVSDRKERERNLEQYETIIETVPEGVFVLDEEGTVVNANREIAELFGLDLEETIGNSIPALIGEGIVDESVVPRYREVVGELLSARSDREHGRYEFPISPKGTDEERIVQSTIALRPYDEEFRGTIGVLQDVTERKQRLEELERFETLVDAIPDTLFATDEQGFIEFGNESGLERFGYSREILDEGRLHLSEFMTDGSAEKFLEATRRMLSSKYDTDGKAVIDFTAVTKDGRRFPAEAHFGLMSPTDDGVAGAGIVRDVTERTRREERLQVLDRVLRHNIRNDVNVILGNTTRLEERLDGHHDDTEGAEIARTIETVGEQLLSMSTDVRRIQQALEHDRVDLPELDLVELVEELVARFGDAYPGADIETTLPDEAVVEADEALQLAVANLLDNAIVHNDTADPTVSVDVREGRAERGDWYDLRIADDGPGIPEQERVVLDEGTDVTPLKHGSGIGLWAVAWIVQSFDGTVSVEDNEPRGSVVVLQLRAAG